MIDWTLDILRIYWQFVAMGIGAVVFLGGCFRTSERESWGPVAALTGAIAISVGVFFQFSLTFMLYGTTVILISWAASLRAADPFGDNQSRVTLIAALGIGLGIFVSLFQFGFAGGFLTWISSQPVGQWVFEKEVVQWLFFEGEWFDTVSHVTSLLGLPSLFTWWFAPKAVHAFYSTRPLQPLQTPIVRPPGAPQSTAGVLTQVEYGGKPFKNRSTDPRLVKTPTDSSNRAMRW